MIVNELFGHVLKELDPLIGGCEQAFISNFIVSFAYRKYLAGEVIQYGDRESFEMLIVWEGAVAVTEQTEF